MPNEFASRWARSRPASSSAGVRGGSTAAISSAAASRRVPLGSPVRASRSIRPSGGSGVARVIPASASARELTHAECPSAAQSRAGRSGTRRSSSAFDGLPSGNSGSCQPAPRIQARCGCAAAYARIVSAAAAAVSAALRSHSPRSTPLVDGVHVGVLKPGSTMRPARSTVSVAGPISPGGRLSVPTYTIRPPRTATALAQLRAASTV